MENVDLLFKNNIGESNGRVIITKQKEAIVNISPDEGLFSGKSVERIIRCVNRLHKIYPNSKIPILFCFEKGTFIDKLTYVLIECICYYLIKKCGHRVQISMLIEKSIGVEGIESSPLLLLNMTKQKSVRLFPTRFEFDLYDRHIRRVISANCYDENAEGRICTEVSSALKKFDIEKECREQIALIVAELVGNAIEHARSDCLMDIDVTGEYGKRGEKETKKYYGINIVVLNFSETLLGAGICRNVLENSNQLPPKYEKVKEAYRYHSSHMDENYKKEDFCNISAFQHKISGRVDCVEDIGGRGLTKLIKSLQERSDAYRCYVVSGKRAVNFYHEQLQYDKDGWIGFNNSNQFLNELPDKRVVNECFIYMPGTAYNLNFIMEEKEDDGREDY